jgi:twitching motility two-component system response regulator PilH
MTQKILLVDDDPDVITLNMTVVEENGYVPLVAENGEKGLALARSDRPDLIILDILMPRQSGIKMYRAIKLDETLKDIPVIILSGISQQSFQKSQETLAGFSGPRVPEPHVYLEKPVSPAELGSTIQRIIGPAEK